MKEKDPSTLLVFQDIVEPFEIATSTPIIIIVSMLVVIVLYLLVRRRRGLLYFIATVERECQSGLCTPREAVQRTHQALDAAGVEYHALKEKFVAYQFSKVTPGIDDVSALLEKLRSMLVTRRC